MVEQYKNLSYNSLSYKNQSYNGISNKNHSSSFKYASLNAFSGIPWEISVVTFICAFGVLTNIINICVFHNSKLKGPSYKILLVKAISSVIYLTLSIGSQYFTQCGYCQTATSYVSQIYAIVVTFYLEFSLTIFHILLDILVSLRRYCILVRKNWIGKYKLTLILILLAFMSLGYYASNLFQNTVSYSPENKRFIRVRINREYIFEVFQIVFQIFLGVFVLSFVNIANLMEYKKLYKFREHLSKFIKEKELLTSKVFLNNRFDSTFLYTNLNC